MILNAENAVNAAEGILTNHYRYTIAPAERRAIRMARKLEGTISPMRPIGLMSDQPVDPDSITLPEILLYLAAMALALVVIGWWLL